MFFRVQSSFLLFSTLQSNLTQAFSAKDAGLPLKSIYDCSFTLKELMKKVENNCRSFDKSQKGKLTVDDLYNVVKCQVKPAKKKKTPFKRLLNIIIYHPGHHI